MLAAKFLRRTPLKENLLPHRHINELWKGGYLDPSATAIQKQDNAASGDAWPSVLLRRKSFDDLHKLWYVCLKERNLLNGERWAYYQRGISMPNPERLKKCKLSMKRILAVLQSREIHQQCLRAKYILQQQKKREKLESQRFLLEEQILKLQHQIQRAGNAESLMKSAWMVTLDRCKNGLEKVLIDLGPLRKETMQMVAPDWKYQRKYSDLPGPVSWQKQKIPALLDQKRKPIRFY